VPQGVQVTTVVPGYAPAQPLQAVLPCKALSLTRGALPAPDKLEVRELLPGSHALRDAPGGAVLGTLTCASFGDCPGAWVLGQRDGLAQVDLRRGGVRVTGGLPEAALGKGSGVATGMLGTRKEGGGRRACGAQTLWVTDGAGRRAELGQLQGGAQVDIALSDTAFSPVWLPDTGWLLASPHQLVLRTADARACQPV